MITQIKKARLHRLIIFLLILNFTLIAFAEEEKAGAGKVEYSAFNLRDPFESWLPKEATITKGDITKADIKLPEFTIQGIILHKTKPTAIVNNQVVKIGDTVSGAKIVEIRKEGIDIIYQGEMFTVPSPSSKIQGQNKGGQDEKQE